MVARNPGLFTIRGRYFETVPATGASRLDVALAILAGLGKAGADFDSLDALMTEAGFENLSSYAHTAPLPRWQAAILALRVLNPNIEALSRDRIVREFSDVPADYQWAPQIYGAVKVGALTGLTDGSFKPDGTIAPEHGYPRVDLAGHSLGGALARWTAAEWPHIVGEVVTFQAPGISKEKADHFQKYSDETRHTRVTHVLSKNDLVGHAGREHLNGDALAFSNPGTTPEEVGGGWGANALGGVVGHTPDREDVDCHGLATWCNHLAHALRGTTPPHFDKMSARAWDALPVSKATELVRQDAELVVRGKSEQVRGQVIGFGGEELTKQGNTHISAGQALMEQAARLLADPENPFDYSKHYELGGSLVA